MSVAALALEKLFPTPQHHAPIWTPYPKQAAAVALAQDCFELLFGGALGGGKSALLRSYAVEYALAHRGAHIGLVRRTLPMLKQTHGLHMRALTDGIARENRTDWTWTFPNGAVIRFISLQHEGDEQQYKSAEFDLLLFDEVTELTQGQYTFMLTRCRSAHGHRVHVIATANPEGVGFRWVKRRWVKPRPEDLAEGQPQPQPGVPWEPPLIVDGEIVETLPARAYIPATIRDNPGLLKSNPGYVKQIQALPDPRRRRALLDGDWDAMDNVPGALWAQSVIDRNRVNSHPDLIRVVVGVDPSGSAHDGSDECGIIAAGKDAAGRYYVLADRSGKYLPDEWAARAVGLYHELAADRVVAETNFGGAMVQSVLRHAAPTMPVTLVTASRGKAVRAEPVSWLYTDNVVSHVGVMDLLEVEQTTWTPESGWSPGRVDALVWAITELAGGASALAFLHQLAAPCPECKALNSPGRPVCIQCGASLPGAPLSPGDPLQVSSGFGGLVLP